MSQPVYQASLPTRPACLPGQPVYQSSLSTRPPCLPGQPVYQGSLSTRPACLPGQPVYQASLSTRPACLPGQPVYQASPLPCNQITIVLWQTSLGSCLWQYIVQSVTDVTGFAHLEVFQGMFAGYGDKIKYI